MQRLLVLPVLLVLSLSPLVRARPVPVRKRPLPHQQNPAPSSQQKELDLLRQEGNAAYVKSDFPTAQKKYQAGLEKAQALKEERYTALFLNNLGNICYSLGRNVKALDYYQRGLALRERLGNPQAVASSLNGLGLVYTNMGQFERARDFHARALAVFEKQGDEKNISISLTNLGLAYYNLGQFEKAQEAHARALALDEKLDSDLDIATSLNNLGIVSASLGQFDKAFDFYRRALMFFEKLGNQQDIAYALSNQGDVYERLGQFDKAQECYQRALALFEKLGNLNDVATNFTRQGNVYYRLEQFDKALEYYNRALAIQKKQNDLQDMAFSFDNMGNAYEGLGQFDKALDFHKRALESLEKSGNKQQRAKVLENLGGVYESKGLYAKALDFQSRALALREQIGNSQEIVSSLTNLGSVYTALHQSDKAEAALLRAIHLYEKLSSQVSDVSQLGALQAAEQGNPYLLYVSFLVQQHRPAPALEFAERGRGQGLARQAQQNRADFAALFAPADARLRRQKQEELTLASALWQATQNRPIPADKQEQLALIHQQKQSEQRYRSAEADWTALEASLRLKYARYQQLRGFAPLASAQFAGLAQAHPDTLFIEYAIVGKQSSLLFALTRQGVKAFVLPTGSKILAKQADDWKRALVNKSAKEPALAQKLWKTVLAQLEKAGLLQEKGFTHLAVVADGPLLDIPFAALMDSRGRRLMERFAVSSAFSLGSLLWPQEQRQPTGTLLCAADPTGDGSEVVTLASRGGGFRPLPATRQEVQELLPLFAGTKTAAYFGQEAQRERVQQEMSQYALLHFATHGVADGAIGLRSGLLLADEKAEAKYSVLEAREIAGMRLAAQMAVLSACETAKGQRSGGEGMLGLAWAFRAAGCPSIVASQWQVDDEATSQLMLAFYQALKAGKRRDEALRQAMLAVRKAKPSPFYWAAFQIMGDAGALKIGL